MDGEIGESLPVPASARRRIERAVTALGAALTKGELAKAIAMEISRFSLHELQMISGRIRSEIDKLPPPYRERVRPYFMSQFFEKYNLIMSMQRSGEFDAMKGEVKERETFERFVDMVPSGCLMDHGSLGTDFNFNDPLKSLFYYLISCFTMFVLEEPGHPVGIPFPGGFSVEKRGGDYLCPIRDKEEDVLFSICNFCPAKQMEGV